MTLPWYLNPWAEVRKWRNSSYILGKAVEDLMVENADLRRRIAEMEKWVPRDPRMADPGIIKMQREAQGVKFA